VGKLSLHNLLAPCPLKEHLVPVRVHKGLDDDERGSRRRFTVTRQRQARLDAALRITSVTVRQVAIIAFFKAGLDNAIAAQSDRAEMTSRKPVLPHATRIRR